MKSTELMEGNIVRDELTGEWMVVAEIRPVPGQKTMVGFEVIDRSKYPLPKGWKAEPIPLNREILQMAGFTMKVKDGHTEWFITIDEDREVVMLSATPYSLPYIPSMPHIKYLHQLQNLVLIVTDTQLQIKRP